MARSRGSAMRRLGCLIGVFMLLMGWLPVLPVGAVAGGPTTICVTPQGMSPPPSASAVCTAGNTYHDTANAVFQATHPFGSNNGANVYFFAAPGAAAANPTIFTSDRGITIYPGTNIPPFANFYGVGAVVIQTTSPDESVFTINPGFHLITFNELTITGGKAPIFGGAVTNLGTTMITIRNSTITGNSLYFSGDDNAGGLFNPQGAVMNLINTTVTGNTAGPGKTGGIVNKGTLNVFYSTIAYNTGATGGAGGILNNGGTVNLVRSIVAGNTGGAGDIGGSPAPTNTNSIIGSTAGLGTLSDNGGPTKTIPYHPTGTASQIGPAQDKPCDIPGPNGQQVGGEDQRDAPRDLPCEPGGYEDGEPVPAEPTLQIDPNQTLNTSSPVNMQLIVGGIGLYTFVLTDLSNDLPPGLAFNPNGTLTGTPTTAGNYLVIVDLLDDNGYAGTFFLDITVGAGLTLSPSTLPGGKEFVPYDQTVTASGGTPSYSYLVGGGALPDGLNFDGATGHIFGTPNKAGTYTFTITATDVNGKKGVQQYTIVIAPNVVLSPTTLPDGMPNVAYSQAITAMGGTGPYTFAVTSGTLPTGLSLNPATGIISGTPTTKAAFTFTVTATDKNGVSGSQQYTVTIAPTQTDFQIVCNGVNGSTVTLKAGQTLDCKAVKFYSDGSQQDVTGDWQWKTSDPTIATVNANGQMTGVSGGTVQIYLTAPPNVMGATQAVAAQITVIVRPPTPLGIAPAPAPQSRPAGTTGQTGAAPAPAPKPNPAPTGR